MAGSKDLYYAALKQSVARCCQSIGWNGVHIGSCDILTDLLARYIMTLGRTASEYANLAEHSEPSMFDLLQTFKDMSIDEKGLLDYIQNVDVEKSSPLPCLPVPHPQKHLFNGPGQRILRKKACPTIMGLTMINEELDGENECESIINDEGDVWEEIPGYFPALPKIKKKVKGEMEDGESGIQSDDDAVTTPISIKSPDGLHSHLKDGDGSSRRSSVSDEIVGGGFAQLPTTFRRQSTIESPSTPTSVPSTPLLPSVHFDNTQSDLPPTLTAAPDKKKSHSPEASIKPTPNLDLHIAATDEQVEAEKVSQMPQLHLMSPVVFTPPASIHSPPSLSPLTTSAPPISPAIMKPLKPVLHKITSPPVCKPTSKTDAKLLFASKEMELKVKHIKVPSRSPIPPKLPSELEAPLTLSPQMKELPNPSPVLSFSISPSPVSSPLSAPASPSDSLLPPASPLGSPQPSPSPSHHSLEPPPLTPSCSPSHPSSPTPLSLSSSVNTPLSTPTKSPKVVDKDVSSQQEHILSLSSSSMSSDSSSPGSIDGNKIGPPPLITVSQYHSLPHNLPSPHFSSPSLSPHLDVPPVDAESFSTTSSDSPSSCSTSYTPVPDLPPPKLLEVSNTSSHHLSLPPLMIPKQVKSPMSCQEEEEDSSDTSESSRESIEYPIIKDEPEVHIAPRMEKRSPRFQLDSPFIGPLTVRIKKLSNISLEFPCQKEPMSKMSLTTSTTIVGSNSKYQNVDSIFLEDVEKGSPIGASATVEIQLSPKVPSSLIVHIDRTLLKTTKFAHSPNVKVTVSKVALTSSKNTSKNEGEEVHAGRSGQTKMRSSRKRELELSEVGLDPKKMRKHSPEPSKSSSVSIKGKPKKLHHQVKNVVLEERITKKARSQASDDGSESDSSSLKLKLKIPKPTPSPSDQKFFKSTSSSSKKSASKKSRQQPQISLVTTAHVVKGTSSKTDTSSFNPSPQLSEGLLVTSSIPKKVPSIKIPKVVLTPSPPPVLSIPKTSVSLSSSSSSSAAVKSSMKSSGVDVQSGATMGSVVNRSGPELYICPICERPDDGTPMICCDNCDIWLHMRCVGLTQAPPENEHWYCTKCARKKRKRKA